jgi:hypothetical protein
VAKARACKNTIRNAHPDAERCLLDRISQMTFPHPRDGKPCIVTYPLGFRCGCADETEGEE